jgi:hypothetical protein
MNTLQAFEMQALQSKYQVMTFIMNTLRKNRGEGATSCSLAGFEEVVAVFKLPLLGGFFAGLEEAQALWVGASRTL